MTKKMYVSLFAGAAILLAACGGGQSDSENMTKYRPTIETDGIDFYATTPWNTNANCYYRGAGKVPNQGSKKNQTDYMKPHLVFIGHDPKSGSFTRFELTRRGVLSRMRQAMLDGDNSTLEKEFASLSRADFQPTTATQLDSLELLGSVSNPFDLKLSWYSRIGFFLIEDTETFNDRSPFRSAVGVSGAKSPFRSMVDVNDKITVVDYVSLPPAKNVKGYETISVRNCIYYYDLSIYQTFIDAAGNTVRVPVIIDPRGEGDNGPSGDDDPPQWP